MSSMGRVVVASGTSNHNERSTTRLDFGAAVFLSRLLLTDEFTRLPQGGSVDSWKVPCLQTGMGDLEFIFSYIKR